MPAADDDGWKPTPAERRVRARLVGADDLVDYKDLKLGDVFQAIAVDGRPIHPFRTVVIGVDGAAIDPDTDAETFAVVTAPPMRGYAGCEGWAVEVEVGSREQLIKRHGN